MLQPVSQNFKRRAGVIISTLVLVAGIVLYRFMMFPDASFIETSSPGAQNLVSQPSSHVLADLEKALETNEQGLSKASVVIQTTRGKIKYKFYSKDAPKTVHRVADLIQQGFYNGLTFHRVIPGFVAQGGDPTGTGMGGSGVKLNAEISARKHMIGTVSMARAQDLNSADSQFYIMLGSHPQLDGAYTVFGQLTEGQDVASQLQVGDRMTSVTIEAE